MGIFDSGKKNIIKIAEEDLNDAKLSSLGFADKEIGKRAFVDILAARLAMKLFFSQKINATNLYSIYTIHSVLKDMDIADIYFKNIKLDVRMVFNSDEIFIPKSHFKNDILPDLYAIFVLKEDLSSAEFLGFIEPSNIDKTKHNKDFYFVEQQALIPPKDSKKFLEKYQGTTLTVASEDEVTRCEELFLQCKENTISESDRRFLYKNLASTIALREKFVEFENFELISFRAAQEEDLLQDNVLDIVGAQKLYSDDLETDEADFDASLEIEESIQDEDLAELDEESSCADFQLSKGMLAGAGAVIAGGAVAVGAAAMAQGVTNGVAASVASSTIEAVGAVGSAAVDTVGNIINSVADSTVANLDEKVLDNVAESSDSNLLDELSDIELEEDLELPEEVTLEEITPEEDPVLEIADLETIDEIELPEIEVESETSEELDIQNEEPIEEPTVISDTESVEAIIEDVISPIDSAELPELSELKPLDEDKVDLIKDEMTKENSVTSDSSKNEGDLVDLDDFDFNIFNDDAETSVAKDSSEIISNSQENLVSFDALMGTSVEETPKKESIKISGEELSEIDDDDVYKSVADNDIKDIASEVDEFLKDIEISDENRSILAEELDIDDILEETPHYIKAHDIPEKSVQAVTENPTEQSLSSEEQFASFDDNSVLPVSVDTSATGEQDLLKTLFKKENISEDSELKNIPFKNSSLTSQQKKKVIIAASVAGVMLVAIAASQIGKNNDVNLANKNVMAPISADAGSQSNIVGGQDGMASDSDAQPGGSQGMPMNGGPSASMGGQPGGMPQYAQSQPNRDMGQAVSEAFMSEPVNANVSKIAWEVPEDLAYNDSFRKYLQTAGKNLKLTLQSDLLLASEMAYSNKFIVDLKIGSDGSVQAPSVVVSSGSKQIDGIVLQSVKETFKYLKVPSSELGGQSINATLIITF